MRKNKLTSQQVATLVNKNTIMDYAIIAAGNGSRLAQEGVATAKPLVTIGGEPMIGRLLRIFGECGARTVNVICNSDMPEVASWLDSHAGCFPFSQRVIEKTTPSSMHSLYELSAIMDKSEPFLLTTVDTIFREERFRAMLHAMEKSLADGFDGMMGVTMLIDDEKPLYVNVDSRGEITGFHDKKDNCTYVSAGIYGLSPKSFTILSQCIERGESRMRNFQRALIAEGLRLKAFDMGDVMDVDHAEDIIKAEGMLA